METGCCLAIKNSNTNFVITTKTNQNRKTHKSPSQKDQIVTNLLKQKDYWKLYAQPTYLYKTQCLQSVLDT